jgi:hypothetical protein
MRSIAVFLVLSASAWAQGADFVREKYEKREVSIPMRDGAKLFTSIYAPKDASQPHPILLNRTPYSVAPYGADAVRSSLGPSPAMAEEGYIFVYQDVRGRNLSEGEFENVRPHRPSKGGGEIDESSDTYDTIEWLVKNLPNHNGRVGQWGISYPGFYTSMGMIDAHPALVAASPQAPVTDWFIGDDWHHNGAFFITHAFRFYARFGKPRPKPAIPEPAPPAKLRDAYPFFLELGSAANADRLLHDGQVGFWKDLLAHGTYDAFWKARNIRPHLKGIRPAVLVVGGWFDAENLFGALETYRAVEEQNPGARNSLVMGPWWHGQWSQQDGESIGAVRFGSKTSIYYREELETPFFWHHLKAKKEPKIAEATVFETGANRWRMFDRWPPPGVSPKAAYLRADGRLAFDPPEEEGERAADAYVSDPAKPVPYFSGPSTGMAKEYMVDDQRHVSTRTDVLVWTSEPLAQDLTLAGPVVPSLRVSTTGTDADFVVKLIDVHPDDAPDPEPNPAGVRMGGYQQLVRGEPFRGRFRKGFEQAAPFAPGTVEPLEFTMPDVCHTFRKGHRIMVHVQSSWFPLVDRNPQSFTDAYSARPEDYRKAEMRVHRAKSAASCVYLPVLK